MECIPVDNGSTLQTGEEENFTGTESEKELLSDMTYVFYDYGLPIVCMIGIIGNILNLTILTRRKLRRSFKTIEQAANACLISLALSDLMFCLFAFPTAFLPNEEYYRYDGFILYYGMYSSAVINVFIMASTWLTVTMAIERYIAICHPFNDKLFMTLRKTKLIIVLVYILSVCFNIPVLWRYRIIQVHCKNISNTIYQLRQIPLASNKVVDDAYRLLWAILGNFIPLILLILSNICICRKIHLSYKYRQKFHCEPEANDTNSILTVTLIVIVVMFFILVAPSEIVMHIAKITHSENNATYKAVEVVMNFMQSVNFSVNFVLYCIISPYYRRTLRHIFCCYWHNRRRDSYRLSTGDSIKMPLNYKSTATS